MTRALTRLIAVFLVSLLAACGGGGSDTLIGIGPGNTNGDTAAGQVQGIWSGDFTVTGQPSTPIFAPIVQNGLAFFFDANGTLYLLPAFTGSTSMNGRLLALAPTGVTFANGQNQESFSVAVTVTNTNTGSGTTSTPSIHGSFSGNGETGTFTLTPVTPFAGTPSVVAGNWQGFYLGTGNPGVALTVQPGGSFVGNDANGCTLSGSISQLQSDQNLFTVSLTSSGSSALCQGQLKGLAFESTSDFAGLFGGTVGTYYYISVSNTSGGFVAELKVQ